MSSYTVWRIVIDSNVVYVGLIFLRNDIYYCISKSDEYLIKSKVSRLYVLFEDPVSAAGECCWIVSEHLWIMKNIY